MQESSKTSLELGYISCPALPYNQYFPPIFSKLLKIFLISGNISFSFCPPEISIRCRFYSAVTAFMRMPETAVDKDNFAVSGKNHIRFTRKVFAMKRITITQTMDYRADKYLWTSVLVTDLRHIEGALLLCEYISHH